MRRTSCLAVLLLMLVSMAGLATVEASSPDPADKALTYGDFAVLLYQTVNSDTPLKDPSIALSEAQRVVMLPTTWKASASMDRAELQRVLAQMNVSSQSLGSTAGPVTRGTLEGVLGTQTEQVEVFVSQSQSPRRPWKRLVDDGPYRAVSGSEF